MQDLSLSIIQTSIVWENIPENLNKLGQVLKNIPAGSTDLIVLPEMFSTGFTMNASKVAERMDGSAMKWLSDQAVQLKVVITGSLVIEEGGKYYNRLIWMRQDGTFDYYDKRHLFRMAEEDKVYTAGTSRMIQEIKGWKIRPLVCYDLRFPVWTRSQDDTDLMIFVANWPEARRFAWKHLLVARAIENLCYVAGVNRVGKDGKDISYSGDSVILDFKGNEMAKAKDYQEEIVSQVLSRSSMEEFRKQFPAFMDADKFKIEN